MQGILKIVTDLINTRLPNFNKKWDKSTDIQILSPMKRGILGIENLNNELQKVLNPTHSSKKEKKVGIYTFREGDKVMQTKNNYSIGWLSNKGGTEEEKKGEGVFNGDMGRIIKINQEDNSIHVSYDDKIVMYGPENMEELELAYAITIHKSQGSEFKVVILPAYMGAPLLMSRNLLYTGITRAKELVTVVGYPRAIKYMVENNNALQRFSTLKFRLKSVLVE